jgi:hypothetical protein
MTQYAKTNVNYIDLFGGVPTDKYGAVSYGSGMYAPSTRDISPLLTKRFYGVIDATNTVAFKKFPEILIHTISNTVTLTEDVYKYLSKVMGNTLALSDQVSETTKFYRLINETINLASDVNLAAKFYREITNTVDVSNTVSKKYFKVFYETVTTSESSDKSAKVLTQNSVYLTDSIVKSIVCKPGGYVNVSDMVYVYWNPVKTFQNTIVVSANVAQINKLNPPYYILFNGYTNLVSMVDAQYTLSSATNSTWTTQTRTATSWS